MAQPLPKPLTEYPSRKRRYIRSSRNLNLEPKRVDAASLASTLQLQEEKRDLIYSFIALGMKLGFFFHSNFKFIQLGDGIASKNKKKY